MRASVIFAGLTFWLTTAATTVALAHKHGGGGGHSGGGASAPEIDGPGGVAAIALLVSVGMIAHNRYKQK